MGLMRGEGDSYQLLREAGEVLYAKQLKPIGPARRLGLGAAEQRVCRRRRGRRCRELAQHRQGVGRLAPERQEQDDEEHLMRYWNTASQLQAQLFGLAKPG